MRHRRTAGAVLAAALGAALAFLGLVHAQQVHRNGFEAPEPGWSKGTADAPFKEIAHDLTDTTAHAGQHSEHIQLTAEQGNFIHYVYPTGRAPITEELSVSVWIKANRPGVQLSARLVLPRERNPNSLDEPVTTILRGDQYNLVSRWQRLELRRPVKLAREQQQLMRAELKRDVDFTDAYIDRLLLNVYSGPGLTELWIDDLELGPILDSGPSAPIARPAEPPQVPGTLVPLRPRNRAAVVEFKDQLLINGKRFFFRGIRHSDTPLRALRDAGFNTVWMDYTTPPAQIEEAVNLGFWVVPALPVTSEDPRLVSANALTREVARFQERDGVLFWDLGGGLAEEQTTVVSRAAQWIHAADPQRPVGADVWDGFRPYSRSLDLVGAHRWPLMTAMELPYYGLWLTQRRQLARPGTFFWTWVQTHLPDWYTTLAYDRPASAGFEEPVGPQPEQIKLLTYVALASGCRGIAFWSDRFLADSHQGRDRLLALALLNMELKLLEPLLATAGPPTWIDTTTDGVQAAVMRTEHGVLALPMWTGGGAQFVPGQSAKARLSLIVPQVPVGTQAWEISPVGVRTLRAERVPGGSYVTIPEFGLTSAVLFTSDLGPESLIVRLQDQTRQNRKQAAQWAHDLAEVELEKVTKVHAQLEADGHTLPDAPELMDDARKRLQRCVEQFNAGDYRDAYDEAQRAMRPMRILMRAHWLKATHGLDSGVATPYAVSYFSLPRHWRFVDQLKQGVAGHNVLPGGDFEQAPDRVQEAWSQQLAVLDDVSAAARRFAGDPAKNQVKEGKQCLQLAIGPREKGVRFAALERTFLAINSPVVRLQPGTPVRISAWVYVPERVAATADGALFYDSAGGEPLAIRVMTTGKKWKKYTLYRQVPTSGEMSVTLALTGLGTAYFDDVRIEPMQWHPGGIRQTAGFLEPAHEREADVVPATTAPAAAPARR